MSPPAPHLVDEIHEEIFLRLPDPAALARASTACPRFRLIITDRSFLRRYRKRHPPPLLGFADEDGFHPAEAPHPSAPLARALADAADFTYSFVPRLNKEAWHPCDIRDGRVLLEGSPHWKVPRNLAVCDPLSRRYVLLPPIPGDPAIREQHPLQIDPVLLPIGEDEDSVRDEDETSFKVICFADCVTKLVAFVFSSTTQKWCIAASASWSSLVDRPQTCREMRMRITGCRGVSCFYYVRGCFYSASPFVDKLLVLDTRKMVFSTVSDRTGYHAVLRWLPGQVESFIVNSDVPHRRRPFQLRSLPRVVAGREGVLEMFSLVGDHTPNDSFDLHHTSSQQNDCESSKDWQLENITPLPGQYDYFTVGAAEGFLFLGATTESQLDTLMNAPVCR
uniref:Uncharacterized protein n=1 Tax=Avena sativa TaxID=4498 RepID=A0ACD5TCF6_AVESA